MGTKLLLHKPSHATKVIRDYILLTFFICFNFWLGNNEFNMSKADLLDERFEFWSMHSHSLLNCWKLIFFWAVLYSEFLNYFFYKPDQSLILFSISFTRQSTTYNATLAIYIAISSILIRILCCKKMKIIFFLQAVYNRAILL